MLSKHKRNVGIEIAPVYCSSTCKTVINLEYDLDKYFQEILYRIDNEGSGWVMKLVEAKYVNICL